MKKKFLPAYELPRLVIGETRTYILVRVYAFGETKRYRPTFNMNRIKSLPERKKRGEDLRHKIAWWLESGLPFEEFDELEVIRQMQLKKSTPHPNSSKTLLQALDVAEELFSNYGREASNNAYKYYIDGLRTFAKLKGYSDLHAGSFTNYHAIEFMDYYRLERGVNNNTYNNWIAFAKQIWGALVKRHYNRSNPFEGIPKRKKQKKLRRNFSKEEGRVVMNYLYENDRLIFYVVILEYVCMIRPTEQRRMRFRNIDAQNGLIHLEEDVTKSGIERTVTIPGEFIKFFKEPFWSEYPSSYLILGVKMKPHPTEGCGRNTPGNRHRLALRKLHKEGKLQDITGLQLYSWKDSGITDMIEALGLMTTFDQVGHQDVKQTMIYRHRKEGNQKVRQFESGMFE